MWAGAALAQEGTLRVALEPTVRLDPAFASSDSEIAVINAVYDYLVDVDADNASSRGSPTGGRSPTTA
jgi:peptide/nickel transport system substrate-binding protein